MAGASHFPPRTDVEAADVSPKTPRYAFRLPRPSAARDRNAPTPLRRTPRKRATYVPPCNTLPPRISSCAASYLRNHLLANWSAGAKEQMTHIYSCGRPDTTGVGNNYSARLVGRTLLFGLEMERGGRVTETEDGEYRNEG